MAVLEATQAAGAVDGASTGAPADSEVVASH
jgi:hypothetical protein